MSSAFPFYDYHIDISINIEYNGEYDVQIQVSGVKPQNFTIDLSINDVEAINTDLRYAIEKVSFSYQKKNAYSEAIQQLAEAGRSAFNVIFGVGKPRDTILTALGMVGHKECPTIEISSNKFFIPWELLYHGPLEREIDLMHFWGMKYILSRNIILQDSNMVAPVIRSARPKVGLLAYNRLRHVMSKELPSLLALDQQEKINLFLMRDLKMSHRIADLEYLGDFLSNSDLQIIHIACHANEGDPINQSSLLFSEKFPVTIRQFTAREYKGKHAPIVILNACRTGTISALYTFNWANVFWKYGARGVLATEFRVPDWFAAIFIEELYKYLLSGNAIGECLWAARQHFCNEQTSPDGRKNLLGLAYALYSPLAVRIERQD